MLATIVLLSAMYAQADLASVRGNEPSSTTSIQQTVEVKGKVVDKSGNPIVGATIAVKGTTRGTATANDGTFALKVLPNDKTIQASFIGMKTQEMAVPHNGIPLNIILEDDARMIEDVIITGYGSYKKSAYAGSASTVKTDVLKDVPTSNLNQMLQGVTPGVTLTGASNQPGSAAHIRIRGLGSFNASNDPLYVIDGVPINAGNVSTLDSDGGFDIMSTINPSDIENLTVVKDAAAASLYGSRAANGLILITTKKGKSGKPSFYFKSDWGYTDLAMNYREIMGGQERRDVIFEGLVNSGLEGYAKDANNILLPKMKPDEAVKYAEANVDKYAPKPWNGWADWKDLLFRKGFRQNYEVSASGGNEKVKYYSSIAFTDEKGITYQSNLNRITGRLNVNYQISPKLELSANVLFAQVEQDVNSEGGSYTSPIYSSRNTVTPSTPAYNQDGTYATWFPRNGGRNPKSTADLNFNRESINRAFNTLAATYSINKDLKLKSTFSYDYNIAKGKSWADPKTSDGAKDNGIAEKSYADRKYMVWSNTISYIKTFGEKHNFDAVIGYEIDSRDKDDLSGTSKNFANPNLNEIGNGAIPFSVGGYPTQNRMVSYISKVNYNFSNKYFLGASYRLDGSSKLHQNYRWGNFWSISGAYRLSSEEFMKNFNSINDLKVRASYGVNATLPSNLYGYYGLTSFGRDYNNMPGIAESQMGLDDLSWETSYSTNLGLDVALFKFLNVSVEWYQRKTKDLLIDKPVSLSTGFSSVLTNEGEMLNSGIEIEIKSANIQKKNFTWTTSLNLAHNRNEILRLDGIQTQIPSGNQIRKVGEAYNTFYLREYAGINPSNGKPQFYTNTIDKDGNLVKEITEDWQKANPIVWKSAAPKVTGGISNYLNYEFIDLGFTFSYTLGGFSFDNAGQKLEHGGSQPDANIPVYYRDRWKKDGNNSKYERFIINNPSPMSSWSSTRRIHSTDHLRLKNITLGASLPTNWISRMKLNKARLYFSANNILTWAAYGDYDPEVPEDGSVYFETPALKTLTFGIELNF